MTDAELRSQYQAAVAARAGDGGAGGAGQRSGGGGGRPGSRTDCPSPDELRALVERVGDETARLATLDHVMSCAACHQELALLQAIHAARPREPRLMPRQWLAAAGLLILLAGGGLLARGVMNRTPDDLTRGSPSGAESAQEIPVVSPRGPVAVGGLTSLVWHAVPGAVTYTVEVLDDSDRVLFTRQTSDTLVPVSRVSGHPAAWWVRASLSDGTDRHSRIVRLAPDR